MTTVTTAASSGPYAAAAQTTFAVDFQSRSADEIEVYLNGSLVTSGYVFTRNDDGTGSVVFTLPQTGSIFITSAPDFEMQTDFSRFGDFYPDQFNEPLDQLARSIIALKERAVLFPSGDTPSNLAGLFLALDASGNVVGSSGTGADAGLRSDLALASGASLLSYLPVAGMLGVNLQTALRLGLPLMPEHYASTKASGIVGDGTDDYPAFAALFAALSNTRQASAAYKPGAVYNINQKSTAGGVADLKIQSAVGLTINGNGAVINILGNFDRDVVTTRQLNIIFADCVGLDLHNYEINGHVDQMTNSGNWDESFSYGHLFQGCTGVVATNVNIHHMATDNWSFQSGTIVGGVRPACRRVLLVNCQGQYGGRMAISLIQVRGFYALNCNFGMSARYTGTYGKNGTVGHAPKSSLDIEPDFNTLSATPMDINTGDIVFERCDFLGSLGMIWSCALPGSVDHVTFRDCTGDASPVASATAALVLGVPDVLIDKCELNLGDGYFQFCHSSDPTVTGRIKGGRIKGTYFLLQSTLNSGRALLEDVDFVNTCTGPYGHTPSVSPPILVSNTNMALDRCRLWMPKEAFVTGGAGDAMQVGGIGGLRRLRDFRFETDLPANQYGATTAHYHLNNLGGTAVPELNNLHFIGTAPGVADTFRPAASSTFDTTNKFNRTPGHPGAIGKRALADAAATHTHSIDPGYAELAVPLTANRVLTLSATDAVKGAELKVTRTAASTGAFTYTVGALKALAVGQWCIVRYNGAAWDLIAFGSL